MKLILLALVLIPLISAAPQSSNNQDPNQRPETRYQQAEERIRQQSNPDEIPILVADNQPLKVRQVLRIRSLQGQDDVLQLAAEVEQRYQAPNLAWGQNVESQYQNASVSRDSVWRPDFQLAIPAEETRLASPARVQVSQQGEIRYRAVQILTVPATIYRNEAPVDIAFESSSYNAQDLIFDEENKDQLVDLSEYAPTVFDIMNVQIQVNNPQGEQAKEQRSRLQITFTAKVRPQPREP